MQFLSIQIPENSCQHSYFAISSINTCAEWLNFKIHSCTLALSEDTGFEFQAIVIVINKPTLPINPTTLTINFITAVPHYKGQDFLSCIYLYIYIYIIYMSHMHTYICNVITCFHIKFMIFVVSPPLPRDEDDWSNGGTLIHYFCSPAVFPLTL